ncbi:MAG: hypothetical protein OXC69_02085 [Candidatus Tectomicrobia bacterium]|nr:hypothetical protein [Candidatus Tectomicrobia bacterium]
MRHTAWNAGATADEAVRFQRRCGALVEFAIPASAINLPTRGAAVTASRLVAPYITEHPGASTLKTLMADALSEDGVQDGRILRNELPDSNCGAKLLIAQS